MTNFFSKQATNGETYKLALFKKIDNSPYEWSNSPLLTFLGRPASKIDKKTFRVQIGVEGQTDSVYIVATNLPNEVNVNDRVSFLGKIWTIKGIGYYFDTANLVNASIFSDDYILARCPKGIVLE